MAPPSDPWVLDELAHAGPEHLDAAFVDGYDRKQGDVPDRHAAADVAILAAHGIGGDATVVDLAAGTGKFAVAAAALCRRVVAVDVSPVMRRRLRQRADAAGATNVESVDAGFLTYEHRGPPADAVHTRNGLHQLPDFWKAVALSRIAGFLRPGGLLRIHDLVYDFAPAEAAEVFAAWFDRAATDPAAGYTRDDYAEHIRTEHSTFTWLFEPMLDAAGFDVVEAERQQVFAAYTCVRRGAGPA